MCSFIVSHYRVIGGIHPARFHDRPSQLARRHWAGGIPQHAEDQAAGLVPHRRVPARDRLDLHRADLHARPEQAQRRVQSVEVKNELPDLGLRDFQLVRDLLLAAQQAAYNTAIFPYRGPYRQGCAGAIFFGGVCYMMPR